MANLLKKHRALLYTLKRQWGKHVDIYRPITSSQNVTTGKIIRTFQLVQVDRAPVLPRSTQRKFAYDLDYIQAGNNFTEGAFFDRSTSEVLLDQVDLPRFFVPNLDDMLVFDTKRFDIKEVERFEGWPGIATFRLIITAVENQAKEKWLTLDNGIGVEGTIS
jgi:hypothetical protein